MNKSLSTKVGGIVLACLLIFMGVSDILLDDSKKEKVARVGKEVITLNEYKSLYQNYGKQVFESNVSEEQVKSLKYNLLNALIEQKLLFNLMNDLRLVVGEESIKDHIKNTKYFQNDKGEFDKGKFHDMLSALYMTEEEYTARLEKILPAMMFVTSLFRDNYPVTFGEKIDEQIYRNRHQIRVVDIVKITKDAVTNVPKPDNQTLLDLYEKNKSSFYYPEYRTVQYISVGQKHFVGQIQISDEEVDDVIEQQKLRDQIDIFNIIFHSKEEAKAARKMFEEGNMNFEQVVKGLGKTKLEEIRMNSVTRSSLPDDIGEKVFALKVGEVSEVLASSFGWHIIKVESAHQVSSENLIDLKKDVKSLLINQKSFEKINDFINQANYKIYNGATIEEISSEYNLPIQTIGPVDASGRDQSGNSVESSSDFISFVFSRKKDQKSYFKDIDNAIVSVKITDIIMPKLQSFEECSTSVEDLWRDCFIKEQMFKIGQEIAAQLKEKTGLEKKIQGVELIKDEQIQRNGADRQNYPFPFVEEIFSMKTTDSVTGSPIQYNNGVIIGVLKEMYSPSGKLNTFDTGKRVMISLKEQLISYLESKYKVEVNHDILDDI